MGFVLIEVPMMQLERQEDLSNEDTLRVHQTYPR